MDDKSESGMERGVRDCTLFVLIVNGPSINPDRPDDRPEDNSVFNRDFCIKEIDWAVKCGRRIQPVVRAEDKQKIGDFLKLAPEHLRDMLGGIEWIDLERNDREYLEVGIRKIKRALAAAQEHEAGRRVAAAVEESAPTFQVQPKRGAAALMHSWEISPEELHYDSRKAPIASGGQADIYRGTWQGIDVALKIARPASEGAKAVFAEFMRREVRALSRCRHPNVVRLYGVCIGERPSVVMPFAAGGSLQDKLKGLGSGAGNRATLPLSESVLLMAGIARGMSAVHAHAIIHLDLKPDNILLAFDGTPWITDFGLATSSNATSFSNSAGGRGTQQYMAPELFRSKRRGGAITSPKADVYSFGVLSWQVLTGAVPWQGKVRLDFMIT